MTTRDEPARTSHDLCATEDSREAAACLRAHEQALIEAWQRSVLRSVPAARALTTDQLVDAVPALLETLARILTQGESKTLKAERSLNGGEHGGQRAGLPAYTLDSMLVEYRLLRRAVLGVLRQETRLDRETEDLIHATIDGHLGNASAEFVRVRSRADQESSEALQRSAHELRRSEQRLRTVVDAFPSLITFVDTEQRYVLVNRPYESWFNVRAEDMCGRTVRELLGEENYAKIRRNIERALSGELVVWEGPFQFADGRKGVIEARYVPQFDETGTVVGYAALVNDITERVAEAARERARSAFEQQLIGIVSHDLKTPLTAIALGATSALKGALGAAEQRTVSRILASAERAGRLIGALLDFTRVRLGGGLPLSLENTDLMLVAADVLGELELSRPGRVIKLEVQGETTGQWDRDRLSQAITNLLENALNHGSADGIVRVRLHGDDTSVLLEVHNLGEPIPSELLPRLFEPLERGPDRPRKARSTGLGLFITRHIVEAHGGRIDVESSAEHGTTFRARLPRERAAALDAGSLHRPLGTSA